MTRVKIFERARELFDIIRTVSSTCAGTIPRSEESVSQGNVLYVNTEKVPNFEKTLISLQWLEGLPKLGTFLTVFYNIVQAKSSESLSPIEVKTILRKTVIRKGWMPIWFLYRVEIANDIFWMLSQ